MLNSFIVTKELISQIFLGITMQTLLRTFKHLGVCFFNTERTKHLHTEGLMILLYSWTS